MKNIQYKLLVLFLFATLAVFAEEDSTLIKRNITIEKEYVPVIKDAGKVNVNLSPSISVVFKGDVSLVFLFY